MIKLKIFSLLIIIVLCSCNNDKNFVIQGKWNDAIGEYVYLKILDSTNSYITIDSAKVDTDCKFIIKRSIPSVMLPIQFYAGEQKEDIIIYNSNDTINIDINKKEEKILKNGEKDSSTIITNDINIINPSKEISVYKQGIELTTASELLSLGKMFMQIEAQKKGLPIDSIIAAENAINSSFNKTVNDYIDSSKNYIATTIFIKNFILKQESLKDAYDAYNKLSTYVQNSPEGKQLLLEIKKTEKVNIGGIPDNFSLPTPDGTMISLESFKGNYLIIDFWASWCAPCLAETANLKKIYNKWGGKGLEIFGISLDEFKDKDKWLKAIEKHNLVWTQVSSLNGWECPIAKRFNVTAIPRMYILNKEGKIIDQDIRGKDLANKIDSLLTNSQ